MGISDTAIENYRMGIQEKMELVDVLLECAAMKDRDTRNTIVNELPADIRSTIQRHSADRVDVNSILNRCIGF